MATTAAATATGRKGHGRPRQHRNGWEMRITIDGTSYNKRIPVKGISRTEAQKVMDAWVESLRGANREDTVNGALDAYTKAKQGGWSPTTRATADYHQKALRDALGDVLLMDLTSRKIQAVYDGWSDDVKPGTIRRRHSVLAAALNHAVRQGAMVAAPTANVDLPRTPKVPVDLPTAARVAKALKLLPKSQALLKVVASVALATGARRGELLALRWKDIDLEAKRIRITASLAEAEEGALERKGTKSGSVRTVSIDDATVAELKAWRSAMAQRWLPLGIAIGEDSSVFPSTANGDEPVKPSRIAQDWRRHREGIGLDTMRFHDLRHRHATSLLENGYPVHLVARRLGHGSPTITLSVYAHAIAEGDDAAADIIAAARKAV